MKRTAKKKKIKVQKEHLDYIIALLEECREKTDTLEIAQEPQYQTKFLALVAGWDKDYAAAVWEKLVDKYAGYSGYICNSLIWVGHQLGIERAEYDRRIVKGFLEDVFDIASSGDGLEQFGTWHRKEFTKLFQPWSEKFKVHFWENFTENWIDEWYWADLKMVAKLLGITNIQVK